MPAIFTHIHFGEEVSKTLPAALQSVIARYPQCFYLGTQGPDLLFYHKPLKSKAKNPARKKGWDLHAESPEGFFLRAATLLTKGENAATDEANAPLAAYVLGFLCHFTLDSQCHPLIDGASVDGLTHGKIESELDKYFLRVAKKPVRGFNAATLFFPAQDAEYASAAILDVSVKNTRRAMRSMKKINRFFSHKCGLVHGVCHFLLTLVGMNGSFGEMFLHKKDDPRCAERLPKLAEKLEAAIPLAQARITEYFENLPRFVAEQSLNQDFYRYNYSGIMEE